MEIRRGLSLGVGVCPSIPGMVSFVSGVSNLIAMSVGRVASDVSGVLEFVLRKSAMRSVRCVQVTVPACPGAVGCVRGGKCCVAWISLTTMDSLTRGPH